MITIICPCGRKVFTTLFRAERKKYCSKKCFYRYRKRPSGLIYKIVAINKGWFKRKKVVKLDNKGYERRYYRGKYKRTHDLILEKKIGRKLKSFEVCHHLNGVKTDNRPENLIVLTKKKHDKFHNGKR